MNRRLAIRAVAGALLMGAVAVPAPATEDPGLRFVSTFAEENCLDGAQLADSTSCTVEANASAANGAVSAHTRLVSPAGGTAPWLAQAGTTGHVIANYQLPNAVWELRFSIAVRIRHAHVSIAPGDTGMAGWYLNQYNLGRTANVNVGAAVLHSSCSDCMGGTNLIVLSAWRPGTTATTSGRDIVLQVKMIRNAGAEIPPGLVTVRAGVGAPVWQTNTWGDDSAGVDAVVRRIALA